MNRIWLLTLVVSPLAGLLAACATDAAAPPEPVSAPGPVASAPGPVSAAAMPDPASSASAPGPTAAADAAPAGASHVGKTQAPVTVSLRAEPVKGDGLYQAMLVFTARRPIPRAVARIVLPEGVTLVRGIAEQDFGALDRGTQQRLEVTIQAPESDGFILAGGVDCHVSAGVQLHGGTTIAVGHAAQRTTKSEVVKDNALGGVRMAPAKMPD